MCHRTPHHFWLFVGITNFDLMVMMVFTKLTNYGVTSDPFVIKKLMVGNFLQVFVCLFFDTKSRYIALVVPETHCVEPTDLKLRDLPISAP